MSKGEGSEFDFSKSTFGFLVAHKKYFGSTQIKFGTLISLVHRHDGQCLVHRHDRQYFALILLAIIQRYLE
jgi:hypothetical protein